MAGALGCFGKQGDKDRPIPDFEGAASGSEKTTAVFAGGCFWGMEAVFRHVRGVTRVLSGYSGGEESTARYGPVCTGLTGHAESVEITFDPRIVSFPTLLRVFFSVAHDPTEVDRQGPDAGSQYRSAIFFDGTDQERIAKAYISQLDRSGVFPKPIATRVVPLSRFYPAEPYHQNFLENNPDYPYVVVHDLPKLAALKRLYPDLVQGL